jgi:hypothetical protein
VLLIAGDPTHNSSRLDLPLHCWHFSRSLFQPFYKWR